MNKKMYEKIIDNRFKISGILIILFGIIGFFINNINVKDWILTTDKSFCFWWNIKFFALILLSYDLFFLITNKNKKLAFIGSILISFSSSVQWNLNNIDSLIIGELLTLLVQNYFDKNKKVLISILFIVFSIIYTFTFRPYAVAFGYLFLALIIWIIIKNICNIKNNKKEILLGTSTILISIAGMIISALFFNNHNIEYSNLNQTGISTLYSYLYAILLPFNKFDGRELLSSFISIFPIPMMISLYYLYKKEDHSEFLLPITIVTVLETVFCISGFPSIISKVTLFSQTNALRTMSSVSLANLIIIFYFLGNVEEELFKIKYSMRITIITACILIFVSFPTVFLSRIFMYLFVAEFTLLTFLFLNFGDKKYQKVLLFFLILTTLISGIPVNFLIM